MHYVIPYSPVRLSLVLLPRPLAQLPDRPTDLDVPVLAERGHHPLLDGPVARATDRDAHLVVAAQAVQLVLQAPETRAAQMNAARTMLVLYNCAMFIL